MISDLASPEFLEQCASLPKWACVIYGLAKDWQTLAAGILAAFAAYATVRAVRRQIADDRKRFKIEQERHKTSAYRRAKASERRLLSAVADMDQWVRGFQHALLLHAQVWPDRPSAAPEALAVAIEQATSDELVEVLMLLGARYEEWARRSDKHQQHNTMYAVIDAAELFALISRVQNYLNCLSPDFNGDLPDKAEVTSFLKKAICFSHDKELNNLKDLAEKEIYNGSAYPD